MSSSLLPLEHTCTLGKVGLYKDKLSTPVASGIIIKHTGFRVQGRQAPRNDVVGGDKGVQKGYTDVNYQH